jgi:hypothetical protein
MQAESKAAVESIIVEYLNWEAEKVSADRMRGERTE